MSDFIITLDRLRGLDDPSNRIRCNALSEEDFDPNSPVSPNFSDVFFSLVENLHLQNNSFPEHPSEVSVESFAASINLPMIILNKSRHRIKFRLMQEVICRIQEQKNTVPVQTQSHSPQGIVVSKCMSLCEKRGNVRTRLGLLRTIKQAITPRQVCDFPNSEFLEHYGSCLLSDFRNRRDMVITRLDVTLSSFLWHLSETNQVEFNSAINPFRQSLDSTPYASKFTVFPLLYPSLCLHLTNISHTSSSSSSSSSSVSKITIGDSPDRGGRVNESRKAPDSDNSGYKNKFKKNRRF